MALVLAVGAMAQEVTAKYNEAAKAFGEKKFDVAIPAFEEVIAKGVDDESATQQVSTAKTYLPKCYMSYAIVAAKGGDLATAIERSSKSAELAELYGDMTTAAKAKSLTSSLYQKQGGTAFNEKNYAEAAVIFEKGYAMNPRNTQMANWLGVCYCETGELAKGMDIFAKIVAMGSNPKYAEAADEAKKNMALYINNAVAALQVQKDYDGVIKMVDELMAKQPDSPILAKVRLQAYSDKKDYNKVIELGEATATMQTEPEEMSNVYFIVGAAYNAKEQKPQAIAAFKKVTEGPNAATAKATVAELSK